MSYRARPGRAGKHIRDCYPVRMGMDLKGIWESTLDVGDPRSGYRYGDVIATMVNLWSWVTGSG